MILLTDCKKENKYPLSMAKLEIDKEFADRFTSLVEGKGWGKLSRVKLGKQIGVSPVCAHFYLHGERIPSIPQAREICKVFGGICVEWLITGNGSKYPYKEINLDNFLDLSIFDEHSLKMIELLKESAVQKSQPASQPASRAEPQQKEPSQQPQAQGRRIMTRRKPTQFEIELAIEQDRCVMERHAEEVIANERYIGLIKESCKQNECYCDPPCEDSSLKILSYDGMIDRIRGWK